MAWRPRPAYVFGSDTLLAPLPRAAEAEQEIESVGSGRYEDRNSFNDLITTLIRKGVLTEAEGKPLLQKRFQ